MTPIPGDRVHINAQDFEVTEVDEDGNYFARPLDLPIDYGARLWFGPRAQDVLKPTLTPRPIEVDDLVTWESVSPSPYTVIAIDGGDAWVRSEAGYRTTINLRYVRRINP